LKKSPNLNGKNGKPGSPNEKKNQTDPLRVKNVVKTLKQKRGGKKRRVFKH